MLELHYLKDEGRYFFFAVTLWFFALYPHSTIAHMRMRAWMRGLHALWQYYLSI